MSDNHLFTRAHGSSRLYAYRFCYDFVITMLYAWCVFEAWVYDAKTQTGEVYLYVLVIFIFAFLPRSAITLILMNILSFVVVLRGLMSDPLFTQAASYFDFGPIIAGLETFFALFGQGFVMFITRMLLKKQWKQIDNPLYFFYFCCLFTLGLTLFVSLHPYTAHRLD